MVFSASGSRGEPGMNSRLRSQQSQPPLRPSENKVGHERQERRRNSARQNHLVVNHGQSAKNKFPKPACADRRRNRRQPYRDDGSNSHAGHNDSRSERQFHLEE